MRQLMLTLFMLALSAPSTIFAQAKVTSEEAIQVGVERWQKHFNAHDAATLAEEYAEQCDVQHGLQKYSSREEARSGFADYFARNPNVKTKISGVSRRMLAPNMYVEDGVWEEWGHSEPNAVTKGLYSSIAAESNGKWYFIHERAWAYPDEVKSSQVVSQRESKNGWWNFLKGEWTWEISPLDTKGTVTYRKAAKGNSLVGRFEGSDGTNSIELSGWRSDTNTYLVIGFGSAGNFWMLESNDISAEGFTGSHSGVLPDGSAFKGLFTAKKIDDNQFSWQSKGKMKSGEEYTLSGKVTRKSE